MTYRKTLNLSTINFHRKDTKHVEINDSKLETLEMVWWNYRLQWNVLAFGWRYL